MDLGLPLIGARPPESAGGWNGQSEAIHDVSEPVWVAEGQPVAGRDAGHTKCDLHRFYRGGEAMLTFVDREWEMLPDKVRHENEDTDARLRVTLLQPFAARGAQRRRLRAALGHAVKFATRRSLCVEQVLSDREAVELMTALALSVAGGELGAVHRQH